MHRLLLNSNRNPFKGQRSQASSNMDAAESNPGSSRWQPVHRVNAMLLTVQDRSKTHFLRASCPSAETWKRLHGLQRLSLCVHAAAMAQVSRWKPGPRLLKVGRILANSGFGEIHAREISETGTQRACGGVFRDHQNNSRTLRILFLIFNSNKIGLRPCSCIDHIRCVGHPLCD